jgi:hypothetical protein
MTNKVTSKLRRKSAPPIRLTDRDREIILALHKYRFLTTDHLQVLTDTKSRWGMNARLRLLYDHKYIDRPKSQFAIFSHAEKRPLVYALGHTGASLLSTRYNIAMPPKVYWTEKNRRVREKHIEHTLGISEFMISIEGMCRASDSIDLIDQAVILNRAEKTIQGSQYPFRWKTKIKHKGKSHEVAIVPDYIFGLKNIESAKERFFFVEIDRGTMPITRRNMSQSSFLRKVLSYADTFERGLAAKRFGMKGFQVLTVTNSQARIKAIQSAINDLPSRSFSANTFLFKTKGDKQAHFPFHLRWQNTKGASADIL